MNGGMYVCLRVMYVCMSVGEDMCSWVYHEIDDKINTCQKWKYGFFLGILIQNDVFSLPDLEKC